MSAPAPPPISHGWSVYPSGKVRVGINPGGTGSRPDSACACHLGTRHAPFPAIRREDYSAVHSSLKLNVWFMGYFTQMSANLFFQSAYARTDSAEEALEVTF